jgi:hypothetical protein
MEQLSYASITSSSVRRNMHLLDRKHFEVIRHDVTLTLCLSIPKSVHQSLAIGFTQQN